MLANETKPDQPIIFDPKSTTLTRMTGRRQKLPSAKPDTSGQYYILLEMFLHFHEFFIHASEIFKKIIFLGLNLWNLLCKNIGKDLSKISMPVTLNEPLSVLQR